MPALQNEAQLVHNQDIAILPVKPGTSDWQLWVIAELGQQWVVAKLGHQELLCQLVGQLLQLGREVLTQGVVHVKPIARDGAKIKVSDDEEDQDRKLNSMISTCFQILSLSSQRYSQEFVLDCHH